MINEKMKKDLIALGIKEDDTVLMHSLLSSLGFVEGGAETVIDTLLPQFDGKVLEAECWLIPAREMWKMGREKLLEKEEYFVEPY